jgi:hypothetical protein
VILRLIPEENSGPSIPYLRNRAIPVEFSTLFDIEHTEHGGRCNTAASQMNKADSDRIHELCSLIAVEQDRQKFLQLCQELNRILDVKRERLQNNKVSDEMSD